MIEDLIKEYNCLKEEAEFATRFANLSESLLYAYNNKKTNDIKYYMDKLSRLLNDFYSREV